MKKEKHFRPDFTLIVGLIALITGFVARSGFYGIGVDHLSGEIPEWVTG